MPGIQKRNTRKTPHRSKRLPTTKMPAYPLDDHWVDMGDRPFVPDAKYPIRLRVAPKQRDHHILSPAEIGLWLTWRGWPMTADQSRRLTDAEVDHRAKRLRSKLTSTEKTNLLAVRVGVAQAFAKKNTKLPLAAQSRMIIEAADADLVSELAGAHLRQSRNRHKQTQKAARKSVKARQRDSANMWEKYVRKYNQEEDETLKDMATRIQRQLLDRGWVPLRISEDELQALCDQCDLDRQDVRFWRDIPKVDRNGNMGYFPSNNTIVRFLRNLDGRKSKRK